MRVLKRQLLSFFLILTLCIGMLPVTATAAEPESEENTQTCSCDTLCTEGDINSDCPVCGAEEADLSQCAGTGETETEPSEDEEPAESTGDTSEQPETVGEVDAVVTDVQAKIDALPTADDLAAMGPEEQQTAYEQVQTAYDAYQALSDDQKKQISRADIFDRLFAVFNSMANTLTEENDPGYTFNEDTGTLTVTTSEGMDNFYDSVDQTKIKQLVIKGDGITVPGNHFSGSASLTSVKINGTDISIGGYAFASCEKLAYVTLDGVTSISGGAFAACTFLTSLELPETVIEIGDSAFGLCTALKAVVYTGSTEPVIGENIFYGDAGLKTVLVPEGYASSSFSTLPVAEYTLENGTLTVTSVPEGVKILYYPDFIGDESIQSPVLGNNITGVSLKKVSEVPAGPVLINSWKYLDNEQNLTNGSLELASLYPLTKLEVTEKLPSQIELTLSDEDTVVVNVSWNCIEYPSFNPTTGVFGKSYTFTPSGFAYEFAEDVDSPSITVKPVQDVATVLTPEGWTKTEETGFHYEKTITLGEDRKNAYITEDELPELLPETITLKGENSETTREVAVTCSPNQYVSAVIDATWDGTFTATATKKGELAPLGDDAEITFTLHVVQPYVRVVLDSGPKWNFTDSADYIGLEAGGQTYQIYFDGYRGKYCDYTWNNTSLKYLRIYLSKDELELYRDKSDNSMTGYRVKMTVKGENAENVDPVLDREYGFKYWEEYQGYLAGTDQANMMWPESYLTDAEKGQAEFAIPVIIMPSGTYNINLDGLATRSSSGAYTFTLNGSTGDGRNYTMSFADGSSGENVANLGKVFFQVTPPDVNHAYAVLVIPNDYVQSGDDSGSSGGGVTIDKNWGREAMVSGAGPRYFYDSLFVNKEGYFAAVYLHGKRTAVISEITLTPAADNPKSVGLNYDTELAVHADYQYKDLYNMTDVAYQWYKCDDAEGTNPQKIDGATSVTYHPPTDKAGTYYYYLEAKFEQFTEINGYRDEDGNVLSDYDPYGWASDTASRSEIMTFTVNGKPSEVEVENPTSWDGEVTYGEKLEFPYVIVNIGEGKSTDETGAVTIARIDEEGKPQNLGTVSNVKIGEKWTYTYDTSQKGLQIGDNTIRITFNGTDTVNSSSKEIKVTLKQKEVTVITDQMITKEYDGTTKATVNLGFEEGAILSGDNVIVSAPDAAYRRSDVGINIPINLGTLTVNNNEGGYYKVNPPAGNITGSITQATLRAEDVSWTYTNSNIEDGAVQTLDNALTYNGQSYAIGATIAGKNNTTLTLSVTGGENANTVTNVGNGSYTFEAAFSNEPDKLNYKFDQTPQKTVTFNKAKPDYTVPAGLTATYGDTLGKVALIQPTDGTWSWKDDNNTSVGNVGNNQFTLLFTPTDTENYKTVEEQVTISVAARKLSAPTDLNWDGKKVTWSAVDNASGYSIQLYKDGGTYGQPIKIEGVSTVEHSFTITEAGSYVVAITTLGEGNYSSSDSKQSDAMVYYAVIIGADTNGSATVNVGNGEKTTDVAMAGTTVTLTPAANTDYVFWKWDTDNTGLTIMQDETDPGKWSFAMPSENVTVTPKFEKIPDAPGVTAVTPDGNEYKSDTWTTQKNVTITVSGADTASGINYYEYSTDNGSNWTKLAPDSAGKGSLTITNDSQTTYIFRTVTRAGTVGDKSEPFVVKLDKTAPTAEININNDKWAEFLNKVTFGKFFKETVNVTITAGDACSGIKSVEYMLSADEFSAADEVDGSWSTLDAGIDGKYSFNIKANNKGSVYVRVIDNAGSTTVINSEGVVVYTDAAQDTKSITFTKHSTIDVSFNVKLNGNTVKALTLEATDEDGKTTSETIKSENYSVKDGTITLKADYLQSLAAGTYTVRVEYNPMGEDYLEIGGNAAPASTTVNLAVQKADRNAPSGYTVSNETISRKADGAITGLSSQMEYRKAEETDYRQISGTELTGLASGVYYVRYAETRDYNVSEDAKIEIEPGRKLSVTLPADQTGYTLTADSDELDWHGNTKLTFTLSDGYSKTDDFAVTAAPGTMVQLQDNKDGTYTLSSIEDDVAISVAGVADITAPAAEIKIRNSSWKEFLNTVTFGHFFKKTTDVTITAEDVDTGSGVDIVEYLLSEKKFEYKEDVDGEWTELTENNGIYTFSIEPDHKAFVYVRVTDKAGNITIINSAGVVVYTDAAQDTGSITFTKLSKADAFFKVKLNGNTVKSLALETTDEDGQTSSQPIDSENYAVGGSTITLKADYLQSLEAGKYTVRVEYNPMGESYVEDTDNEAPLSTTIELNIQRVAGTVTIDKDTGKIYDGTAVSPVYSTNNKDGEAVVEYKAQGADDAKYTTAAPKDFGDYTVRVTVKADEEGNYTEASAVQDFEIRKKELTVNVSVSDKQYNSLDNAQFDGTPELSGVVEGDEVTLINGEPSFSSVAVGENISIKLTDFSIDGEDAENYYLTQPEGITANIYNNYNAEQDTDYTVNSNEWLNTDFVITAMNGYSLSLTNTAGGKWTDILSASDETTDGILEFYVRNNSTGAISTAASESYKIDKTAPTGEIKIGENGWKEFLNNITFGLFFKETQTVSIDSDDTLSGIVTVEYASSETPLTLEEVKALTSWQKGESTDVTPEDGKRFIYYARITDNAGNVICLSTDGAEYDLTAPVINGISDGGTYCISAEFTVSENNLKEVQVDGSPAAAENGAYTLTPGEHTVKVVDKADNSTQIKVTVNEKHTPEEDDGDCTTAVKCSVCGEVTTQAQEQHDYTYTSNGDGTHTIGCTRCGYSSSENCSGGKADCTSQAVCDKCGQPYGDKDPANHTNLVKTEAKPATHLAEGNTEYWYCDGCNRYFSDEAGTQEISLADTVIPKLTEHTADGTGWHLDEDSHWHTCECGEIIDKAGHTFEWVTDKEATETETGSKHEECTVCGYEKEAVEIPATGTQDEPAEPSEPIEPGEPTEPDKPANPAEPAEPDQPSETPHATGDDKTESAETLQTGDDSNYILWIVLLAMSGVSITGTAIYRRKRKDN